MNSTITILDLKIIVITVRWRGLEGWRRSEVRVVGAGWMGTGRGEVAKGRIIAVFPTQGTPRLLGLSSGANVDLTDGSD